MCYHLENQNFLFTHVNKIHKWIEILLVILSLVVLYLIGFVYVNPLKPHYFFMALAVLYSFRAFMEWKFEKVLKLYIISMLSSSGFLVIFIGIELFFS